MTHRTRFEPDVRLIQVDHGDHASTIPRTLDLRLGIVQPRLDRIANIDGRGAIESFQLLVLHEIEPEAAARGAAVHFYSLKFNRFHASLALGALHRANLA